MEVVVNAIQIVKFNCVSFRVNTLNEIFMIVVGVLMKFTVCPSQLSKSMSQ